MKEEEYVSDLKKSQEAYVEYNKKFWRIELKNKIDRLKKLKVDPKYIAKLEAKLNK